MSDRRAIVAAAAIVMLGNIASRFLGVFREQIIAYYFGDTATTSAFVAATTIPTMVYDLLIGGAISAALVPVFSELMASGRETELRRAVGTVMVLVTLMLTVASLALIVLAPAVVSVLVPGLELAVQEQAIYLTRLALPAVVLLGLSGVAAAMLYARQTFTYPAFTGALYNLGIIVAALLFALYLGVTSLIVGVLIGTALHLLIQLFGLRRSMPALCFDLRSPVVTRIIRLYAPVALGLVISQIGIVIDRNLASRTGDDSLAVLRFATTLVQFPIGMVVTAATTAILPTLSRQAAVVPSGRAADAGEGSPADEGREDGAGEYTRTLAAGLRMALLIIIPLMLLMIVEREGLVRLLFERGAFSAMGTQRTAQAFLFYAPQLPFVALDLLLISAFYSRQDTRTPMLVGVLGVGVFLSAGIVLIQVMGMPGLALANTVQHTVHSLVLLALIWRMVGGLQGYGLGPAIGQACVASVASGGIWWLVGPSVAAMLGTGHTIGLATYLMSAAMAWAVCYCGILYVWGVPEMRLAWRVARARLGVARG